MNSLQKLARWAAQVSAENHPSQWRKAQAWTQIALFDTIGVMIGGSDHPSSQMAHATVAQWGDGTATVVGQSRRLAAPWAAFVNGVAAHALDFNTWDERTAAHSPPVLLAGLLAVAEAEGKSGADVIDAFIVGMEVAMRIGAAVNLDHYHIGWHTTSTVAMIGGAAACGRLLRLNATAMGHAISIALSHAGGYKSQFGTLMKPIHCGMGAKNGVVAAYLAKNGVTGSAETLDGKWSFLTLQATEDAPGFDAALADLGETLTLADYGIVIKPYPSCAYTHRSIDGLLDLMNVHHFAATDVAMITATIPFYNASILPYTHPTDDTQARFSMAYCLATALQFSSVLPEHFADEMIFAPETRAWLERIKLETWDVSADSHDLTRQEPALVSVTLHDGTLLEKHTDHARGMPQRPLNNSELQTKFMGLAASKLGTIRCEQLAAKLWHFAQVEHVGNLMQALQVYVLRQESAT